MQAFEQLWLSKNQSKQILYMENICLKRLLFDSLKAIIVQTPAKLSKRRFESRAVNALMTIAVMSAYN